MSHKPENLSRRTFVQRSAMLLSSLGLGASVQAGLLDAIVRRGKKDFGTAMAATTGPVDFYIQLTFRAGFQSNSLFSLPDHVRPMSERDSLLNHYFSPVGVQSFATGNANPLYLTNISGAGVIGGGNPLGAYASQIAYSNSVSLNNGHTALWATRSPSTAAPDPALAHAAQFTDSPVKGVVWHRTGDNNIQYRTAGLENITALRSSADFINLYKDLPMYFTMSELKTLVGAFSQEGNLLTLGANQRLDEIWRTGSTLKGAASDEDPVVRLAEAGRGQSTLSIDLSPTSATPFLPRPGKTLADMVTDFGAGTGALNANLGGTNIGEALMYAYKAFAHPAGLLRTFAIDLDSNDWHGDNAGIDLATNKQGMWAQRLSLTLAAFMDYASNTENPRRPGTSIADSLLISMSSEFSRQTRKGSGGADNPDGGSQALMLMGTNVKGGSYGNINVANGSIQSFDVNTGAIATGAPRVAEADVYATTLKVLGVPDASITSWTSGKVMPALVRG